MKKISLKALILIFSVSFVYGAVNTPQSTSREVDGSRFAFQIPELLQRSYDLPGQKAEWVLGTSILGTPEMPFENMMLSSLTRRYPSMLAGLYIRPLSLDLHSLALNGENGLLQPEARTSPIDTPITDLTWERFAFGGNSLKLNFQRLLSDSIQLDLGVVSHSNKLSKEFAYQDVTHQPFFTLGRDSLSIPFNGRNIAMNSIHLQPSIRWFLNRGELALHTNFLFLDNSDVTPHKIDRAPYDLTTLVYLTDPYSTSIRTQTYALEGKWKPTSMLKFEGLLGMGNHGISYDSLPDSTWAPIQRDLDYETITGKGLAEYQSFLHPALIYDFEFYDVTDNKKTYFQDRSIGYLQLQDTLGIMSFKAQGGLQRNSSFLDTVEYEKAYSLSLFFDLPYHLNISAATKFSTRFPDINELKITNTARYAFPNKNLLPEKASRSSLDIQWLKESLFYGLGFRYETLENAIRMRWITETGLDSIAKAFQWVNIDNDMTNLSWIMSAGFYLGNWKFYFERGAVIHRNVRLLDTQNLYYKGSVFWSNRFVKNRLGVSVRFDFQWFGDRYDCAVNEEGVPEIIPLNKYLALNFEAKMQILSFELYSRIDNLNHSLYKPAAGYTPEGVRFSYGIIWTFLN